MRVTVEQIKNLGTELPEGVQVGGPWRVGPGERWRVAFRDGAGRPVPINLGSASPQATATGTRAELDALKAHLEATRAATAKRTTTMAGFPAGEWSEAECREYGGKVLTMMVEAAESGDTGRVKNLRLVMSGVSEYVGIRQRIDSPEKLLEVIGELRKQLEETQRGADRERVASFAAGRQSDSTVAGAAGSDAEVFGPRD